MRCVANLGPVVPGLLIASAAQAVTFLPAAETQDHVLLWLDVPAGTASVAPDPIAGSRPVAAGSTLAPEPATWAMMLLGFGLIGSAARRRRSSPRFA